MAAEWLTRLSPHGHMGRGYIRVKSGYDLDSRHQARGIHRLHTDHECQFRFHDRNRHDGRCDPDDSVRWLDHWPVTSQRYLRKEARGSRYLSRCLEPRASPLSAMFTETRPGLGD